MKFSIKIFLTFFILLSGISHSHAHKHQCFIEVSQEENIGKFQIADFDSVWLDPTFFINDASYPVDVLNNKIYLPDTENEENELSSSKKWLELSSSYPTTVFRIGAIKYLYHDTNERVLNKRHFCPLPSCKRYIMFRVFRI
jgi:hypothetical protein